MKHKLFRSLSRLLLGTAALGSMWTTQAHAFDWSDTSIHYWYGSTFREPGVTDSNGKASDIGKNIVTFNHVDGYKYGTNFFNIDVLMSNSKDPSNNGTSGAQEVYALYRHNLSLNAVTGTKNFALGPLRDISIEAGFDLNTKNTTFAPRKRMLVFGPNFQFDVPGFWNVALLYHYENNYNGIVGQSVHFRGTGMLESAWAIPFNLGGVPVSFEGFADVVAPKGKDGFGESTKTEILFHPKLMVDVGSMIGMKKNVLQAGVGWEYWYNKFGNNHHTVPGALANTLFVEAAVHF
ncbi:hypothetical protein PTE30175_04110 [Pandoraea terrae]|uniref:Nucleoside-binding outer membrane protein n=1 Tax=Pandoraea terrae TaxID=1537710 RepID=A0A5E4Y054_9BURK|nr:hypothetical protein [Pandoraea terrae]VVE42006.1 hypothetical protein PTE30175_04110 [Pandoraea terrae]